MKQAHLSGISYYLPKNKIDNAMISNEHPEWSIEKISTKIGINNRWTADKDEFVSDMAIQAAELLFAEYHINREDIDFILLCTQSPDYVLPTTSCIIQDKLKLPTHIGALDFNLGCSGYIYGLGLAKGLIQSGQANNVLFLTADTYSKLIHTKDKSNKTLFGDAATATLVSSTAPKERLSFDLLDFCYGTDGSGYDNLIVKNSGAKRYAAESSDILDEEGKYIKNDSYLYMDGTKIFNFTSFNVPPMIQNILEKNRLTDQDISFYIFHQANSFMLDFIRKRCKIDKDKFFVSMDDVGNTVSSSIPIALKRLIQKNVDFNHILLCGFGVGLSIGGLIIKKHEN
jgi:3-oxoacyl-[acyl-carrier-protein] synthase-3